MQKISGKKKAKVIRLWLDRGNKAAIARTTGVNRSTVYRVLEARFGKPLPSVESAIAQMQNSRKGNASNS